MEEENAEARRPKESSPALFLDEKWWVSASSDSLTWAGTRLPKMSVRRPMGEQDDLSVLRTPAPPQGGAKS